MGYSIHDSHVRVDRFKERGKWYDTIVINMVNHYEAPCLNDCIEKLLKEDGYEMEGWIYVCLEPYHQYSHPVMLKGRT